MLNRNWAWAPIVAIAVFGPASLAHGTTIPVTGWDVHNGTATVTDGTTNSPSFKPADDSLVVMAPFGDIPLLNDGDYVTLNATLNLGMRNSSGDSVGETGLNTQLRIGLFDGPAGAVAADDFANPGFIIEYSDAPAGGLIREQTSLTQTNPFVSPTNIGNGVQDSGDDHIQGTDIGPVDFTLTLTRNSGMLDISGQISGTDSTNSNPYLSTYSVTGYAPVSFAYNRVGFFFGPRVDGDKNTTDSNFTGTLNDVTVTTNVPEPGCGVLFALFALGGVVMTGSRLRTAVLK